MTDEVADAGAARQLRAERRCSATPASQAALAAAGAPAVHPPTWSARGELDRALEFLPTDDEIDAAARRRRRADLAGARGAAGLRRRSRSSDELLASALPDEPWSERRAARATSRRRCASGSPSAIDGHPLRREIVTTGVVNDAGQPGRHHRSSSARRRRPARRRPRSSGPTSSSARCSGSPDFWADDRGAGQPGADGRADRALPGVPPAARPRHPLAARRPAPPIDVAAEIAALRGRASTRCCRSCPSCCAAPSASGCDARAAEFAELRRARRPGARRRRDARRASRCSTSSRSPTADRRAGRARSAGVYFALSERFEVDRLLTRITALPRDDRWQRWPGWRCATTSTPRWPGSPRNVLLGDRRIDRPATSASRRGRSQRRGLTRARAHARGDRAADTSTSPPCRSRCGRSARSCRPARRASASVGLRPPSVIGC